MAPKGSFRTRANRIVSRYGSSLGQVGLRLEQLRPDPRGRLGNARRYSGRTTPFADST